MLDHEKLDVYQVSLDFSVFAYQLCKNLKGNDRHARDQLLRSSQSIVLNIAEGNGKVSAAERKRFLQIASGSARESSGILDILSRCSVIKEHEAKQGKETLVRVISMLTKIILRNSPNEINKKY